MDYLCPECGPIDADNEVCFWLHNDKPAFCVKCETREEDMTPLPIAYNQLQAQRDELREENEDLKELLSWEKEIVRRCKKKSKNLQNLVEYLRGALQAAITSGIMKKTTILKGDETNIEIGDLLDRADAVLGESESEAQSPGAGNGTGE